LHALQLHIGQRPQQVAAGGPNSRSSRGADSPWPAGPNQAADKITADRPRSCSGMDGADGAVTSMARRNSSSPPVSHWCWYSASASAARSMGQMTVPTGDTSAPVTARPAAWVAWSTRHRRHHSLA
jgi:hypothetical protein